MKDLHLKITQMQIFFYGLIFALTSALKLIFDGILFDVNIPIKKCRNQCS